MTSPQRPQDAWKTAAPRTATVSGKPAASTSRRWFWAALLLVGLVGTIAGLLVYMWPEPPPELLAIPVTVYDSPDWSPNPWAEADARGLLEHARGDSTQSFQAQEKNFMLRELNRVADQPGRRPLLVYLSMLGVVEGGKPHLIPGRGRPDDPGSWLTLDEVLSPLRRATAPRLLVLDIRPVREFRAHAATQDVNELIDSALDRLDAAGDLPFFVLTANTPADGANVLRPLHRTAFGLATAQAAGGAADGWNADRKRNGRVSVREFGEYTRQLTHHASVTAGLPVQVPRLHGSAADFDLFRVGDPLPLPTPDDPEPYPEWLRQAWADRDEWVKGTHRSAPRLVRHLEQTALRAEQRWLAGENAESLRVAFEPTLVRLREAHKTLVPLVVPVASVARAAQNPGLKLAEVNKALQSVFDHIREAPSPERDAALTKEIKAIGMKPPDAEPFDTSAVAVWKFARELEHPTHEQMKQLAALVAAYKPHPARHAELLTIGLIAGLPPERAKVGRTIPVMLEAATLAEEAAAIDGRCLPWVQTDLERADARRRQALRTICAVDADFTDADREAAVKALDTACAEYRDVRSAADALARLMQEYEETRAVLVDLAVAFPLEVLPRPEVVTNTWAELVENVIKVQTALKPPAQPRLPDRGTVEFLRQSLESNRNQLLRELPNLRVAEVGSVRKFERLLRWPGWSATDRLRLVGKLREAEGSAVRAVLDRWPTGPSLGAVSTSTAAPRLVEESVRATANRIALLRIAEVAGAEELKRELDAISPRPTNAAVESLAAKVRAATRSTVSKAYEAADAGGQARFGWLVDPDDVAAFPQTATPNPESLHRRTRERAYHDWLARSRYTADAEALRSISGGFVAEFVKGSGIIAEMYGKAFR